MAGHDARRLQRIDPVERRQPVRVRQRRLRVGHPDMNVRGDRDATDHGPRGRNPHERAIGRRAVEPDDAQRLAVDAQRIAVERLRHDHRSRRVVLQDRAPVGELAVLAGLDRGDGLRRRDDLRIRERRVNGFQPEVIVGVAVAHVDGLERLAARLDPAHQRLSVVALELGVDQDRLGLARNDFGRNREDRMRARIVDIDGQRGSDACGCGAEQRSRRECGRKQMTDRHGRTLDWW
ncbi:Uncharacterised protein [Burkholderia cenocepacia]|nr:Uncharacterised protein [Burkholderia cenocepacia]